MNPKKTLKGGKIDNQSRPSLRAFYSPYESNNKIGFRCAK
jgi:formylglycine-generating enzyme required for sulfatase activity